MRNAIGALTLLLLSACSGCACSGGTNDVPASVVAPSAPAASDAFANTIATEQSFGCTLVPRVDGYAVWAAAGDAIETYAMIGAHPTWAPLPTELARAAPGDGAHATIMTADGPCTATLDSPELRTDDVHRTEVRRRVTGCASDVPFAFVCPDGSAVPSTLRYATFMPGEVTPLDASTTDPGLRAAYVSRESFGDRASSEVHPSYVELVRGRVASVFIERERIAFAEIASSWFAPGTDVATGCPEVETHHNVVYAVFAESPAERVAENGSFVGVLYDGLLALALVEAGTGSGAEACEGASTCTFVALWTHALVGSRFLRRSPALAQLGDGELVDTSPLTLTGVRPGCDPED